jgi:protein-tyrosine phosphatase
MTPLADTHVHLLAGLDDGPSSPSVALAMCRQLVAEGVRHATALAHQNEDYPENDAQRLLAATEQLKADLAANNVPLAVHPTGEVMLTPNTFTDWQAGRLVTMGNRGKSLLVEMPHGLCVNLLPLADLFRPHGVRLIIAHAERWRELLEDLDLTASWIAAGCLIQVTANALADPRDSTTEKSLKRWATGGFIHLLGSDGHGIDRRRPEMTAGYARLEKWVGSAVAARIGGEWGQAVLEGRSVNVPPPRPKGGTWFSRLFGG